MIALDTIIKLVMTVLPIFKKYPIKVGCSVSSSGNFNIGVKNCSNSGICVTKLFLVPVQCIDINEYIGSGEYKKIYDGKRFLNSPYRKIYIRIYSSLHKYCLNDISVKSINNLR